jgi:hypothetical protein
MNGSGVAIPILAIGCILLCGGFLAHKQRERAIEQKGRRELTSAVHEITYVHRTKRK